MMLDSLKTTILALLVNKKLILISRQPNLVTLRKMLLMFNPISSISKKKYPLQKKKAKRLRTNLMS